MPASHRLMTWGWVALVALSSISEIICQDGGGDTIICDMQGIARAYLSKNMRLRQRKDAPATESGSAQCLHESDGKQTLAISTAPNFGLPDKVYYCFSSGVCPNQPVSRLQIGDTAVCDSSNKLVAYLHSTGLRQPGQSLQSSSGSASCSDDHQMAFSSKPNFPLPDNLTCFKDGRCAPTTPVFPKPRPDTSSDVLLCDSASNRVAFINKYGRIYLANGAPETSSGIAVCLTESNGIDRPYVVVNPDFKLPSGLNCAINQQCT